VKLRQHALAFSFFFILLSFSLAFPFMQKLSCLTNSILSRSFFNFATVRARRTIAHSILPAELLDESRQLRHRAANSKNSAVRFERNPNGYAAAVRKAYIAYSFDCGCFLPALASRSSTPPSAAVICGELNTEQQSRYRKKATQAVSQ